MNKLKYLLVGMVLIFFFVFSEKVWILFDEKNLSDDVTHNELMVYEKIVSLLPDNSYFIRDEISAGGFGKGVDFWTKIDGIDRKKRIIKVKKKIGSIWVDLTGSKVLLLNNCEDLRNYCDGGGSFIEGDISDIKTGQQARILITDYKDYNFYVGYIVIKL